MKLNKSKILFAIAFLLFAFTTSTFSQQLEPLTKLQLSDSKTQLSSDNDLNPSLNEHFGSKDAMLDISRGRVLPLITIHLMGGYSLPLPDLKGGLSEYGDTTVLDPDTYHMKGGYNFGADGHIAIGKKRQFRVVISAGYVSFGHSQDGYYFRPDSTADSSTVRKLDLKLSAVTVGVGVEWAFRPFETMNPFVGLDFTGHFYSGYVKFDPAPTNPNYHELKLASESRFGVAIGGGVDFAIGRAIGAVIGIKYNLQNLIGKKYDSTGTVANEIHLDDKEHTVGTTTVASKNISDLQFYGGVSFYFGQPPRKIKK